MRQPLAESPWRFDSGPYSDEYDDVRYGADLAPNTVIAAYRNALFPMPEPGTIAWWSPLRRGVLVPSEIRITRSLRKSMKRYSLTVNKAFTRVMRECADPRRPHGWIDEEFITAYTRLHKLGWAHSIETWLGDELVGGLYGVSIGRLFAGESMFHHATDASKVALVELARIMHDGLIDTQWLTPHLASLGAVEYGRDEYVRAIAQLVDRTPPPEFA